MNGLIFILGCLSYLFGSLIGGCILKFIFNVSNREVLQAMVLGILATLVIRFLI